MRRLPGGLRMRDGERVAKRVRSRHDHGEQRREHLCELCCRHVCDGERCDRVCRVRRGKLLRGARDRTDCVQPGRILGG